MSRASLDPDTPRTLAHVADPAPAPDHSAFWKSWYTRLIARAPALRERLEPDPSDPGATHEYDSGDGVRIGAALIEPERGPACAGLLIVHGAQAPRPLGAEAARWRRLASGGLLVLAIRLRGYPGSRTDPWGRALGWSADETDWITRGLSGDDHEDWVLPGMAADVCDGVRALAGELTRRGVGARVFIRGRSLGAGLGVIAAAQLNGRETGGPLVARLSVGCPSLGDVRWRLDHAPSGLMAPVRALMDQHPDRRAALVDRLRLCDAAVHARRVGVPTLAMLAARDGVVAPQSAAALFNAINADPGRKWRVVVPVGHGEPSYASKRSEARFRRIERDFLNPARRPIDAMRRWEPGLAGDRG